MSTNCMIGLQNADGTVTGIYCHWDGYVEYAGKMLLEHYNTEDRVLELLALGDLSDLNARTQPTPGSNHSFSNTERGVCVAYGRDRGDVGMEARYWPSANDFFDTREEYNYLFVPGEGWTVFIPSKRFRGHVTVAPTDAD